MTSRGSSWRVRATFGSVIASRAIGYGGTVKTRRFLGLVVLLLCSGAPVQGSEYEIVADKVCWSEANAAAQAAGGHLATIGDQAENDLVFGLAGERVWIGFTDQASEGDFVWVTGEPVTFTNWAPTEPNDEDGEDFTELTNSGAWNDLADCGETIVYAIEFESSSQSSEYRFVDGGVCWSEANAAAQAAGGHLVTIGSQAENDLVRDLAGGAPVWIGFTDQASEGDFVWVTGEPVTFTNWAEGEPNDAGGGEDFANFENDAWNDVVDCSGASYVIEFDEPQSVDVPGGDTEALEDALEQASANPEVTTEINLGAGEFVVEETLPEITSTVEIRGTGNVTLSATPQAKGAGLRMAQVGPTGTLLLSGVTVQGFSDSAIEILGSAQISNVVFENNSNPGDAGGAITARDGQLQVTNSVFSGNSATVGGAIYAENMGFAQPAEKVDRNPGPLRLQFNRFQNNIASDGAAHINAQVFEAFDDKVDRNPIATIANNTFANAIGDELIRLEGGGFELIDNSAVAGAGQTFVTSNDFDGQSDGDNRLQGNAVDGTGCDPGNATGGPPFASTGYNIYADASCPSDGPGDQANTDPGFGPVGDDGVIPLAPGSPAIDAGPSIDNKGIDGKGVVTTELPCDYKDIRGLARPQDGDGDGEVRCDVGAWEVQDGPDIGAAQSGPFFDMGRSGEGIFVEMLGGGLALVYVFTYTPDGSGQAWILGVGTVVGNSIVVDDIQITSGGIFGPDFDPDTVVRESWGGFSVSFPDCEGNKPGVMSFTGNEGLGYESLITRASRIASIIACPGQKQAFVNKTGIDSSYSGSWFDPGHDGEGFILEVLNATTVVVQWFTYGDKGNQFWIQGVGSIDGKTITVKEAFYTRGTSWGDDFNPDDVERVDWGTIVISFDGCDSAIATYESLLAEFGSGTQNLQRITTLGGLPCS